ncbi:histone deacetylase 8 [Cyathus striatus]|nr:histone deacetylase 8 [Cyathus striatus]
MIVHSLVSSLGLMKSDFSQARRIQAVNPRRATRKELSAYHTREYLDFILDPNNSNTSSADALAYETIAELGLEYVVHCPLLILPELMRTQDCPLFQGLADYVPLVGGATLTAVEVLRRAMTDRVICWDGGRHHAQKSRASGFCYVADCVLAILALKRQLSSASGTFFKPRVMYLDLDLHYSDAVSEAFHSQISGSRQTLTLSIHHTAPGFFPVSPRSQLPSPSNTDFDPFTLSIPLQQGASDETYARIWPIVEEIKAAFNPDYLVLQCGTDGLAGDPCATFNWSLGPNQGSMGWCVQRILNKWNCKVLLLGGGGYNSPNTARAWSYLTSIALDNPLDLEAEIPDHSGFPLYAPSFTLDVPRGNMQDNNSEEYLTQIVNCYKDVIRVLQERLSIECLQHLSSF